MLCGRTSAVEQRASGPVITGSAASASGFFSFDRWARKAVLRMPGISMLPSVHIERAPAAMRSDGLLHRIGNMLREKVTVAAAAEEEEAGGRRRTERGRDGARKKFGVLTRTWSTRRHYCLLNNRAKVPPPKGTLAPRSAHARRAHVDPNSSIHLVCLTRSVAATDELTRASTCSRPGLGLGLGLGLGIGLGCWDVGVRVRVRREHLLEVSLGDGQVCVLLLEVLDLVAVEALDGAPG